MRRTRTVRLSEREHARLTAASAEAGVGPCTFLREAAVEVADRVLRGEWQAAPAEGGRELQFQIAVRHD